MQQFNHIIGSVEAQLLAIVARLSQHTLEMAEKHYNDPRSQIDMFLKAQQLWTLFETLHESRD